MLIVGLATGVAAIPEEVRSTLLGVTSLYVLAMVVLGSAIFRNYEAISDWLRERFRTPEERRAERERQRELDTVTLD